MAIRWMNFTFKELLHTSAKQIIILQSSLYEKPWILLLDVKVQVMGLQVCSLLFIICNLCVKLILFTKKSLCNS